MAISLSEIDAELARRNSSADNPSLNEIDAELARRGAPPETWLNKASNAITGVMDKAAPYMAAGQKIQNAVMPGTGIPEMAADIGGQALNKAGEMTAGGLGYLSAKVTPNPVPWAQKAADYGAAATGMVIANAPMFLAPEAKAIPGVNLIRPQVPLARQGVVSSAEGFGMNPTWAQKTGSKMATGIENFLEKTPMGSAPLEERTAFNAGGLAEQNKRLSGELGTQADVYSVGQGAQEGQSSRTQAMNVQRRAMFEKVPQDVQIPLKQSVSAADQIIQEQSKFMEGTRNTDVVKLASDVQNAAKAVSDGTANFSTVQRLRDVLNERIKANNKGIQAGLPGQSNALARDYTRLKSALDADINAFGSQADLPVVQPRSQTGGPHALFAYNDQFGPEGTPRAVYNVYGDPAHPTIQKRGWGSSVPKEDLDKLGIPITGKEPNAKGFPAGQVPFENQEFAKSYRRANAFSGAYQGLFKSDEALALAKTPPEKVVDTIFKKNNETAIKKFRALVGEVPFQEAKKSFTQEILNSPNVTKELSKYEPGTLRAIFTEPELSKIQEFGSVQGNTKTVANLQGTQGSARSNIHAGSYAGLIGGLSSGAALVGSGHPLAGLGTAALGMGQFLAPRTAAELYLKAGEGMLSTGISQGVATLGKRALIQQFIDHRMHDNNQ